MFWTKLLTARFCQYWQAAFVNCKQFYRFELYFTKGRYKPYNQAISNISGMEEASCLYVFNSSNAEATFFPKHKDAKSFEKYLNPVILVFIG